MPTAEKVQVIVTGGTGFIGQLVARAILQKGALLVHQPSGIEARRRSPRSCWSMWLDLRS